MPQQGLKAESTEDGFFEYNNSEVHFIRFGNGEKLLIALHGFGDRASLFSALETGLKNDYTVYAFDLPYHGQTQWQSASFSQKNMLDLFEIVLKKENKKRFELMGFSFGGRIVLSMIFELINKVDKIYLIAPDGIQTKGMFSALVTPVWFRRFLQKLVNQPDTLIKIMEKCQELGLLSSFSFQFIQTNLATPKRRERLFNTWVSLSDFGVDLKKTKAILKVRAIPVELYFGKSDKIIPPSAGEKLSNGIPNIRLHLIDEGHRLVNERLNDLIRGQLKVT